MEAAYRNVGTPLALGTATRLSKHFPPDDLNKFLNTKDSFTLFRPKRKQFPRNYYMVTGIGDLMECDLLEIGNVKNFNKGKRYILVAIDVFSKKLYARALKNKQSKTTADAMQEIINNFGYKIKKIQTDAGKEFVGGPFQKMLKENGIEFRIAHSSDSKAVIVERAIRTLRMLISRYRVEFNTNAFVSALPKILNTYNSRVHSTIRQSPDSVNLFNAKKVLQVYKLKWSKLKRRKPKFKINDQVRIRKKTTLFTKESEPTFTREIFKIVAINTSLPLPMYILQDANLEYIRGNFLEDELQLVVSKT